MVSSNFTPWLSFAGGAIIAVSIILFRLSTGRFTGLSGIVSGTVPTLKGFNSAQLVHKLPFITGLLHGSFYMSLIDDTKISVGADAPWFVYVIGGLLVGAGTRLGNGCTSGHGICGLSNFRKRSLASVLVFLTTGIATSTVIGANDLLPFGSPPTTIGFGTSAQPILTYCVFGLAVLLAGLGVSLEPAKWRDCLVSYLCAVIFAVGLVIAGMAQRQKVVGFLNIDPNWDPSLMFVLGAAVMICTPSFFLINKFVRYPGLDSYGECKDVAECYTFGKYSADIIGFEVIMGGWLFGLGWGLTGLCPGPAVLFVGAGYTKVAFGFFPALLLGMFILQVSREYLKQRLNSSATVSIIDAPHQKGAGT